MAVTLRMRVGSRTVMPAGTGTVRVPLAAMELLWRVSRMRVVSREW
jgi:hypothetical protein